MVLSSERGHWLECQNLFFFLLFQFAQEHGIITKSFETICTSAEIRKMVLYLHRCISHKYFKRCRFQNSLAEKQLCYGNDHCRFSMPTKSSATGAWPKKKVLTHFFWKLTKMVVKLDIPAGFWWVFFRYGRCKLNVYFPEPVFKKELFQSPNSLSKNQIW